MKDPLYYVRKLGEKFTFVAPTPTRARKIVATEAVLKCDYPTQQIITRQLGHTLQTDSQYYQAIRGRSFPLRVPAEDREWVVDKGSFPFPRAPEDSPSHPSSSSSSPCSSSPCSSSCRRRSRCLKAWQTLFTASSGSSAIEPSHDGSAHARRAMRNPAKKRIPWTSSETEKVTDYFIEYVERRETPSLSVCKDYLKMQKISNRTDKNVQDKVRNIYGNYDM